jgi:hypothetical protein
MLGKTFPLTELVNLELRAEAFNVTIHPRLAHQMSALGGQLLVRSLDHSIAGVSELVGRISF